MSDDKAEPTKPRGLFARLFGRGEEPARPAGAGPDVPSEHDAAGTAAADPRAVADDSRPADMAGGDVAAPAGPGASSGEAQAEALPAADAAPALPAGIVFARPAEPEPEDAPEATRRSWWQRLREGLKRTSSSIGGGLTGILFKRKLDAATLEDLEDLLIQADLGIETAQRVVKAIAAGRYDKEIDPAEVRAILAREVEAILTPVAKPLVLGRGKPHVLLMVGVNGSGKTTTIGKLSQKFRAQGLSVMLAAGDTFRAAAIEQLQVWGQRTGARVISGAQGADAAGLAFEAMTQAKAAGVDVLMIDTAGRLQNKAGLMAELEKIVRVIRKVDPDAPHDCVLVLDATVGQNAVSQVEAFGKMAGVTGLVMTKLDGTARGGILVALAARFGLPVHFIGVGEGVGDLEPFAAADFARAIAGLDDD